MLNFFANSNFDNPIPISLAITVTVAVIGITYGIISSLRELDTVIMERPVDTTRIHEGLPTDLTLTPEDFSANPELAEIFDISDTDNNLNIILESNEHFELVQDQIAAIDYLNNFIEVIQHFLTNFF